MSGADAPPGAGPVTPADRAPPDTGAERLNALPAAELEALLLEVCASREWAWEVAARRPFDDDGALAAAAAEALAALPLAAWRAAVEALGDGPMPPCDDGTRAATVVALSLYRERFGWRFVTAHENLTGEQLLMRIRIRLGHEEPAELRKSRAEHGSVVARRVVRLAAT
jgi:2-oxo-4-hydroxy-4-carboxy-5-ureidoimidazoline decarboxylase